MFVKNRIERIRRVVHNRDLVPHVPLMSQDYHHTPYEILFTEDMGRYQICNESGEDESCSNAFYPNYTIEDHLSYWVKLDPAAICGS